MDILLVEDSAPDAQLIREFFTPGTRPFRLHWVKDGEEAMNFLKKQGEFTEAPKPHLILLDLNLPRQDGRQTLRELRQDACCKLIPVIILTTSDSPEDVREAYAIGANCYLIKPSDIVNFQSMLKALREFWVDNATFSS